VAEALDAVGRGAQAHRQPPPRSGGQQQRVALARAIVIRPRLLLLDEPLSNLDAALRLDMRAELRRIQRALRITMLYVTHDQEEALALSDRVVVMNSGRIEQDAAPAELFQHPATPFVASFMGYENLFAVASGHLVGPGGRWALHSPTSATHLAWRPASVAVVAPLDAALQGQVLARSYLGETVEFLVRTPLGPVKGMAAPAAPWHEGDAVGVVLDPDRASHIGLAGTSRSGSAR
jgi:putative spermidine/putrescine transport system ATP-binding protein